MNSDTYKVFTIKNIIGFILTVLLASVFFFSAYSKIYNDNAIDNFQWTFIDLGINSMLASQIIARILIGFELILGTLLLGHIFLKQITYPAILVLLSIFTAYLLVLVFQQGNNGNCGCFGDKLAMTPLQAIIKNILMAVITIVLYKIYPGKLYKYQDVLGIVLAFVCIVAPFLYNTIYTGSAPVVNKRPVDLGLLYKFDNKPQWELRSGKKIVAFMSLTCPHCKKAAYLLHLIHNKHPEYPLYMVLSGAEEQKTAFFKETHADNVPYFLYLHHTDEFIQLAGPGVPSILWFNNGKAELESKAAYYQLDPSYIKKWVDGDVSWLKK